MPSRPPRLPSRKNRKKKGILDRDQKDHRSKDVIARDKAESDTAEDRADKLNLVAAQKAEEAVVLISKARLLTSDQISSSDLFDVTHGTKVTGFSGSSSAADVPDSASDMFRGSRPSQGGATVFPDGQPVGTGSFIEWKTKEPVTLQSVGLFAAHDVIRSRRSFRVFKLYVKKPGGWSPVTEYTPGLSPEVWYGGSCNPKNCVEPGGKKYEPGTVLEVCINVPPTTGQEFRAVFVQTATFLDDDSGPRVLQLDGYSHSDCAK